MAYVKKLFNENFLNYASYVIKDRAIPDISDGLKPVQRRILHSLFEMDDGKFHKVANVVGHCMKYHPHGDASIYAALVVLANKDLFIDRQGNFGNIFTGDEASAARYIECRASPLAKEILYNPKITRYVDSYDGRNREPETFPAKLPVILLTGTEGIAVGMSTKILPHNPVEVVDAEIACLRGKRFELLPDFPTGGLVDVADYADGNGKVKVRANLDTSDPKRIVIREIPFGSTTESLIASVEAAARSGRIRIASIADYTTERVEIEIRLQRGVYTEEVVDALYAFTECEQSISCNCLLIEDEKPVVTTVHDVVAGHAKALLGILEAELRIEEGELLDDIHARTLERIFIEERIYKAIETMRTQRTVNQAVIDGLLPYAKEIAREVTGEDVERLLKIPIRRISLYDIDRAREEMRRLRARLEEVREHLVGLTAYAIAFLTGVRRKLEKDWIRKTRISGFHRVDAKEVARRDIPLRYDGQSGYLGTGVSSGERLFDVSSFDRIMVVRRSGIFTFVPVPEKLFVDQGLLHCAVAGKERIASTVMTIVYRDASNGFPCIKRCRVEGWIMNKDYSLVPGEARILAFSVDPGFEFTLEYKPKPRSKVERARFIASRYDEKGLKAQGVRLANREVVGIECDPPCGTAAIVAAARAAEELAAVPGDQESAAAGGGAEGSGGVPGGGLPGGMVPGSGSPPGAAGRAKRRASGDPQLDLIPEGSASPDRPAVPLGRKLKGTGAGKTKKAGRDAPGGSAGGTKPAGAGGRKPRVAPVVVPASDPGAPGAAGVIAAAGAVAAPPESEDPATKTAAPKTVQPSSVAATAAAPKPPAPVQSGPAASRTAAPGGAKPGKTGKPRATRTSGVRAPGESPAAPDAKPDMPVEPGPGDPGTGSGLLARMRRKKRDSGDS
jgi:topoisomerase IV subunit A